MPNTATPSDRLTPKSALRYRPLPSETRSEEPPRVARASRLAPTARSHIRPHTATDTATISNTRFSHDGLGGCASVEAARKCFLA